MRFTAVLLAAFFQIWAFVAAVPIEDVFSHGPAIEMRRSSNVSSVVKDLNLTPATLVKPLSLPSATPVNDGIPSEVIQDPEMGNPIQSPPRELSLEELRDMDFNGTSISTDSEERAADKNCGFIVVSQGDVFPVYANFLTCHLYKDFITSVTINLGCTCVFFQYDDHGCIWKKPWVAWRGLVVSKNSRGRNLHGVKCKEGPL
ncbi:hypothetical protein K504DRAFT_494837 [Pleomassaria siparia CBS 279.74]|uniref:Uncharacterized protein n=1 Tax=Pleomassaria siparia CBS 279.74 TaxID=1314801 RepID=A0A6G1JWF4_9PLEO|nr:hypothetical protein K504DRAFT_494837 [Pleomassaria siparia CBS 279.74]